MEPHTAHGLIGIGLGLILATLGVLLGARRIDDRRRTFYRSVTLGVLGGCITPYFVFVVLGHPAARVFLPLAVIGFVVVALLPTILKPVPGATRGGVA